MSSRRSSDRFKPNSSSTATMETDIFAGSSNNAGSSASSAANARKRAATGDEAGQKKVKTQPKKTMTFKPQPLPNSSSTPPDDDDDAGAAAPGEFIGLPPPSERKIARRRQSTVAKLMRERSVSPIPTAQPSRKPNSTSGPSRSRPPSNHRAGSRAPMEDFDDEPASLAMSGTVTGDAPPTINFLSFKPVTRPRPSAAPPPSPPHLNFGTGSMGPPTETSKSRGRKSHRTGDFNFDSMISLPIGDTPVITKNKQMRNEASRRSSLGMRGQRASSSFGRGEPSYPHASVSNDVFYKHIPNDIPEPIKARYLMVWCLKRAVDEDAAKSKRTVSTPSKRGKGKTGAAPADTAEIDTLVASIVDDAVTGLAKGQVDTNVFSLTNEPVSAFPLQPHPRNIANKEQEQLENSIIKQCKDEERDWRRIVAAANARQRAVTSRMEELASSSRSAAEPDLSTADEWVSRAIKMANKVIASGQGDLGNLGEFADVEFKVDTLLQKSHAARQYSLQAARFLDGIFSSLASDLRARDEAGLSSASLPHPSGDTDTPDAVGLLASARAATSATRSSRRVIEASAPGRVAPSDPIHMLRALATVEATQQSEATIAKAASVAVAVGEGGSGPAGLSTTTPRRPGQAGPTPRRTGAGAGAVGTTPRRAGVYGRGAGTPAAQ